MHSPRNRSRQGMPPRTPSRRQLTTPSNNASPAVVAVPIRRASTPRAAKTKGLVDRAQSDVVHSISDQQRANNIDALEVFALEKAQRDPRPYQPPTPSLRSVDPFLEDLVVALVPVPRQNEEQQVIDLTDDGIDSGFLVAITSTVSSNGPGANTEVAQAVDPPPAAAKSLTLQDIPKDLESLKLDGRGKAESTVSPNVTTPTVSSTLLNDTVEGLKTEEPSASTETGLLDTEDSENCKLAFNFNFRPSNGSVLSPKNVNSADNMSKLYSPIVSKKQGRVKVESPPTTIDSAPPKNSDRPDVDDANDNGWSTFGKQDAASINSSPSSKLTTETVAFKTSNDAVGSPLEGENGTPPKSDLYEGLFTFDNQAAATIATTNSSPSVKMATKTMAFTSNDAPVAHSPSGKLVGYGFNEDTAGQEPTIEPYTRSSVATMEVHSPTVETVASTFMPVASTPVNAVLVFQNGDGMATRGFLSPIAGVRNNAGVLEGTNSSDDQLFWRPRQL